MGYRVTADIGGTFTDIVVMTQEGTLFAKKALSTPDDYSRGLCEALQDLLAQENLDPQKVDVLIHASTVATNAILTQSGARVALITTKGFRDILEIRRLRMPRLYDISWTKPPPLVPRYLRQEVEERIDFRGQILLPLREEDVKRALDKFLVEGVESVAVCLINAYANPIHEQRIGEITAAYAPHLDYSLSHRVLPEIKEYERTSTTVINAYIRPVVGRYLKNLGERLARLGIRAPLLVMQSTGGVVGAETAIERPIYVVESGPAAGVTGAASLCERIGCDNAITLDMGGTTAKVALIEGGSPRQAGEYEVGAGVNIGHRLVKGAGYLLRVPAVDLAEVGAGGGSISWVDKGGVLQVGPASAGAEPGPVCYGRGGTDPTVTDANVVLGYLNPKALLGGELQLDADKAAAVIQEKVGRPLGLQLAEAAYGIHTVANSRMIRGMRAVSSERGRDPRDFVLVVFGGSGPVHAVHLAQEVGIRRVIIPPGPGVFSCLGLLLAEAEHVLVQTYWHDLEDIDLTEFKHLLKRMASEASHILTKVPYGHDNVSVQTLADMRYAGQNSELWISVNLQNADKEWRKKLRDAFETAHEAAYGYRSPDERVQVVNARVSARALGAGPRVPEKIRYQQKGPATRGRAKQHNRRRAYFGHSIGWLEVSVVERDDIPNSLQEGPIIVDEYDSTIVIPPRCTVRRDTAENLIVEVRAWS